MIYSTIGIPSRFSEWCEAIFTALLNHTGTPSVAFVADRLDQISRELLVARTTSALVVSRQPQKALVEALTASKSPVMVTLDTPHNAVKALVMDYSASHPDAVRRIANSLTSFLPAVNYDLALVLRAADRPKAVEVATQIARHFLLGLDDETIRAVAAGFPEHAPELPAGGALHAMFDAALGTRKDMRSTFGYGEEDDCTTVDIERLALEPLWEHLNGSRLQDIFWHPALLTVTDRPGDTAVLPIDITGSHRCLLFGPYIQLPEGPWSCSLLVGCSKTAAGVGVIFDIFAGAQLNCADVTFSEPGLFEIEMSFVNPNPDAPLEIRLFSTKANFEGELLAGSVRLTPQRAKRLRVE